MQFTGDVVEEGDRVAWVSLEYAAEHKGKECDEAFNTSAFSITNNFGNFHASEIRFVFGEIAFSDSALFPRHRWTSNDHAISDAMQGFWGDFARPRAPRY